MAAKCTEKRRERFLILNESEVSDADVSESGEKFDGWPGHVGEGWGFHIPRICEREKRGSFGHHSRGMSHSKASKFANWS